MSGMFPVIELLSFIVTVDSGSLKTPPPCPPVAVFPVILLTPFIVTDAGPRALEL